MVTNLWWTACLRVTASRSPDARRLLIERVAFQPLRKPVGKIADLLRYLGDRVLDDRAGEIHRAGGGAQGVRPSGRIRHYQRQPSSASMHPCCASAWSSISAPRAPKSLSSWRSPRETNCAAIPGPHRTEIGFVSQPAPTTIGGVAARRAQPSAGLLHAVSSAPPIRAEEHAGAASPSPPCGCFGHRCFEPDRPTDIVLDDGRCRTLPGVDRQIPRSVGLF